MTEKQIKVQFIEELMEQIEKRMRLMQLSIAEDYTNLELLNSNAAELMMFIGIQKELKFQKSILLYGVIK